LSIPRLSFPGRGYRSREVAGLDRYGVTRVLSPIWLRFVSSEAGYSDDPGVGWNAL